MHFCPYRAVVDDLMYPGRCPGLCSIGLSAHRIQFEQSYKNCSSYFLHFTYYWWDRCCIYELTDLVFFVNAERVLRLTHQPETFLHGGIVDDADISKAREVSVELHL